MAIQLASPLQVRLRNGRPALTGAAAVVAPVDGTLTVDDHLNQRVYQRVGTSKNVWVSGAYTGDVLGVQARAVDATTGTAVTEWATIAASPSGGTYGGLLTIPQGCWYKLEVRDASAALTAATTTKIGVGVIIGMIGQSNMANRPSTYDKYPLGDPRAVEFVRTTNTYKRTGTVKDTMPPNTPTGPGGYSTPFTIEGSRGDGQVYLANLVSAGLNIPVCLIERAVGGSSILSWLTGQGNWATFANAVTAAGGDMEVVLMQIGETDADLMSAATMKLRFADVHNQCKALTGRNDTNFHFGVISLGQGYYQASSEGEFGNMRAAAVQYGMETPGAFLSTCAHDTNTVNDFVHISGEGFARMGRRDAKSVLHRLGVGVSGAGPYITAATRNGTAVTLAVSHSGGTALTDGLGGNGTALTGFQFLDAGAAGAAIGYTTAIAGNTIVCTLASAPIGALTASYAMMNCPHGPDAKSYAPASVVYDNSAVFNSPVGCPLQPLAAITVTGA